MDWIIIVVVMAVMLLSASAEGPAFFPSPFAYITSKVEAGAVLGCAAECLSMGRGEGDVGMCAGVCV